MTFDVVCTGVAVCGEKGPGRRGSIACPSPPDRTAPVGVGGRRAHPDQGVHHDHASIGSVGGILDGRAGISHVGALEPSTPGTGVFLVQLSAASPPAIVPRWTSRYPTHNSPSSNG